MDCLEHHAAKSMKLMKMKLKLEKMPRSLFISFWESLRFTIYIFALSRNYPKICFLGLWLTNVWLAIFKGFLLLIPGK